MTKRTLLAAVTTLSGLSVLLVGTQDTAMADPPRAFLDGTGEGWRDLTEKEFVKVNCPVDTFQWKDGVIYCTGKPTGVLRTTEQFTNFELSLEWRHMKNAGNSGVFLWTIPDSIKALEKGKGRLPQGIEVQVLDLGYTAKYEKGGKRKADWFTCHGDVFPVGKAKMKPFAPMAPNKRRSFPSKNLSRGTGKWNHYYIRAINGEVRLWVNGEEVSGGTDCQPAVGYLCLESEGSPVEFKGLRIRVLP
jgi:3-keto-disaccharide hydrolase